MRDYSNFAQMFADIAAYVEEQENPVLNMMDMEGVLSRRFWSLR